MGPALHDIFVGQGPRTLLGVRCEKESPSHGFAVPAPFRQGGLGTGEADCHSQCAHWLRNDREFYMGCGGCPGGEIGEAPPVADAARRFRGSAPIGGHNSGRESVGTMVGKRTPPLRRVTRGAVGGPMWGANRVPPVADEAR